MSVWKDLRYGVRQLRATPGFTALSVAAMAVALGAQVATFTVVSNVLYSTLPYPEPDRLALIQSPEPSAVLYEMVRAGVPGLDTAAEEFGGRALRVSAGYFHVLGVAPLLGREFAPGDVDAAILSHQRWRREFASSPAAIGATVLIDRIPHRIVGVMPRAFHAETHVDTWAPLPPTGPRVILARLRPGVSWAEAEGQLSVVTHFLAGRSRTLRALDARLVPYREGRTGGLRGDLLAAWAASLLIVAIASLNVASLALARAPSRRTEVATRLALGAAPQRIVRQLLLESTALALAAYFVGLACGAFALDALRAQGLGRLARWNPIEIDLRVLLVTLAVALSGGLLAGIYPALSLARLQFRPAGWIPTIFVSVQLAAGMWMLAREPRAAALFLIPAIGLYALIARRLVDREREFTLRLALGAPFAPLAARATIPAAIPAAAAIVAGLLAPSPLAFAATCFTLLIALAAALRVRRLDPAGTLRRD